MLYGIDQPGCDIARAFLEETEDWARNRVGSASGVLTTMQRGGNALGVAALEVPSFLTPSGAGSRGLSQTASYVQAFGAVVFWTVLMLLTVVGLRFSFCLTDAQVRHNADGRASVRVVLMRMRVEQRIGGWWT